MKELEYAIEQNKKTLLAQLNEVFDYVTSTIDALEAGNEPSRTDWTDGFVARDVAKVTALLARHHALNESLRIVKKQR